MGGQLGPVTQNFKAARALTPATAGALGFLMLVVFACGVERPESVVLIVVDTLGADHMSLYGSDRPTSPFIDELAKEGRVFDRAFATSPWTLPSFGTILTGLLPSNHAAGALPGKDPNRQWDSNQIGPLGQAKLDAAVPTLAEKLAPNGYRTLAVVQNPSLDPAFGLGRGFAIYDYHAGDHKQIRRADAAVDRALALIDEAEEQEFFLMVHLFDPHLDYDPPARTRGSFTRALSGEMQLPVGGGIRKLRRELASPTDAQRSFVAAAYDEEILFVDEQVGRLIRGLKERGLWDRCLVIFTADHGEEFFQHGGFEHGHSLYNELLHVPLIVWGPGIEPGRDDTPVSIADIAPTVLDAVGLPVSSSLIGESLLRADSPTSDDAPPRLILAEGTLYGPELKTAIRWPYKVIVTPTSGQLKLFDLDLDPLEQTDLLPKRAGLASSLRSQLEETLRLASRDAELEQAELDEEIVEKLRAMGYLERAPLPATAWRLNDDQREAMLSRLVSAGKGNPVWFSTSTQDSQAEVLRRELADVFAQAGWKVGESGRVSFQIKPGLYVFMADSEPPAYADAARTALEEAGFQVTVGTGYRSYYQEMKRKNPDWKGFDLAPEQTFVIVVGRQP